MDSTPPQDQSQSKLALRCRLDGQSEERASPLMPSGISNSETTTNSKGPKIPNDIWYVIRDKLARMTNAELDDDKDSNKFTAWLRTLRLVSRNLNAIFEPLAYRTLVLARRGHISNFARGAADQGSEWKKFIDRLALHTIAIKTSVTVPDQDSDEIIKCISEAKCLQTLIFKIQPPSLLVDELSDQTPKILQASYLVAFLQRSTKCRFSLSIDGDFLIEEIATYDPYLRPRREHALSLSRNTDINGPVSILDIAAAMSAATTKQQLRGVEVLHIKIPRQIYRHFEGLRGEAPLLPPMKALILENYNWKHESRRLEAPLPWNFSQLESLTLQMVALGWFFYDVSLLCLVLVKRLVMINCIYEPESGVSCMKPWFHTVLKYLPNLEELVILDDWMTYIDIAAVFADRTQLRRLELIQTYHLGYNGDQGSDQMSVGDLEVIRHACPELRFLRLNLDMEQHGADQFLQSIGDFLNLESLHLETYDDFGSQAPPQSPLNNTSISSSPTSTFTSTQTTELSTYDLLSNAKLIVSKIKSNKFGQPLKKIVLIVTHWLAPASWQPPGGATELQDSTMSGSSTSSDSALKGVKRMFVSHNGVEVEEVWGVDYD